MSEIGTLLTDLSEALDSQRFGEAASLANDLQQAYDERRDTELDRVNKAGALLADPTSASVGTVGDLSSVIRNDGGTRMTRALLQIVVSAIAESPEELREEGELSTMIETAQSAIAELQTLEPELEASGEAADAVIDSSEVPASLRVVSADAEPDSIAIDESSTLTIDVRNVGDRAAQEVKLKLSPPARVSVDDSEIQLGELAADTTETVTAQAQGSASGQYTIEVQATGAEANQDRASVVMSVTGGQDGDQPSPANYADADGVIRSEGLNDAVQDYLTGDLRAETLNTVIQAYLTGNPVG